MAEAADLLEAFDPGRVVAAPDGSVDSYVYVFDAGSRVTDRAAFGDRVEAGDRSFRLDPQRHEPGGQSVNMAVQSHALGADTCLYGHCDHSVFAFPFETVSLGEPAWVTICDFEDGDLLLAEESVALQACDDETLRAAGAFEESPDAVCLANWSSVHGVTDILGAYAAVPGEAPIVLDPGSLSGLTDARAARFRDALSACADHRRVVVSANAAETRDLAEVWGIEEPAGAAVAPLRDLLGVDGYVLHATPETVAATPDGTLTVETVPVDDRTTDTGGGDRFSGALACALGEEWPWRPALELADAAASYYIRTGETADRGTLRALL
ncbi:hypothetical protein [Halorarius halobius]|uniref:hypothetical protein n=1 Tax=Halorarius halobius TaxID=2962671 RepID=UPI0020CFE749|nr:hypothetical protein [Halorarius halobius]